MTKPRPHRCSTCGKRTLTFGGLMRHYLRSHPIAVDTARRIWNGNA